MMEYKEKASRILQVKFLSFFLQLASSPQGGQDLVCAVVLLHVHQKVLLHMEVSSTRFTVNMEREHSTHQYKVQQTCGDTCVFERFSRTIFSLIVNLALPVREMSPERKIPNCQIKLSVERVRCLIFGL